MLTARCGSCRQLGLIDVPYRNEMGKSPIHAARAAWDWERGAGGLCDSDS